MSDNKILQFKPRKPDASGLVGLPFKRGKFLTAGELAELLYQAYSSKVEIVEHIEINDDDPNDLQAIFFLESYSDTVYILTVDGCPIMAVKS